MFYGMQGGREMNNREEMIQALVAGEDYIGRLSVGMKVLAEELKKERTADTEKLLSQCVGGVNWIVGIYNQLKDVINKNKDRIEKATANQALMEYSMALQENDSLKISECLEKHMIPFLKTMNQAFHDTRVESTPLHEKYYVIRNYQKDLLITFDCAGFEFRTENDTLSYNNMGFRMAHILFHGMHEYREELRQQMNFSMFVFSMRSNTNR